MKRIPRYLAGEFAQVMPVVIISDGLPCQHENFKLTYPNARMKHQRGRSEISDNKRHMPFKSGINVRSCGNIQTASCKAVAGINTPVDERAELQIFRCVAHNVGIGFEPEAGSDVMRLGALFDVFHIRGGQINFPRKQCFHLVAKSKIYAGRLNIVEVQGFYAQYSVLKGFKNGLVAINRHDTSPVSCSLLIIKNCDKRLHWARSEGKKISGCSVRA